MTPDDDAARTFLDALHSAGLQPEVVRFEQPVPTAAAAAEQLACDVGAIANSLVFDADGEPVLVLASGAHRVDTAKVAADLGLPRLRRASPEFVRKHTGQVVGGVGPCGHPRPLRTVIDRDLTAYDRVWAGAGDPHSMVALTVEDLQALTGAPVQPVR